MAFLELPKPRNSAGRNLPVAIAVGVALGVIVIAAILIGPLAWYFLVALAVGGGIWEVSTRLRERDFDVPRVLMIAAGQLIIWLSWPFGAEGALGGFTVAALAIMFGRLIQYGGNKAPVNYLRDTAMSIFVMVWIALFASFAAMLSLMSTSGASGASYILTFMICVVASDTGGYIAGVLFGSRPMVPAISPKKSWEGLAGSLILGTIAGGLTVTLLLNEPWWLGLLLGAALVLCATLGDLVESQFKREIGIKDMSNLIPGHGGIMDRLDGMLPSAAVTWVLLSTFTAATSTL